MRRRRFYCLLLAVALLFAGCAANTEEETIEINPNPVTENKNSYIATLYFGNIYAKHLVGEVREIEAPVNERIEQTVLDVYKRQMHPRVCALAYTPGVQLR